MENGSFMAIFFKETRVPTLAKSNAYLYIFLNAEMSFSCVRKKSNLLCSFSVQSHLK